MCLNRDLDLHVLIICFLLKVICPQTEARMITRRVTCLWINLVLMTTNFIQCKNHLLIWKTTLVYYYQEQRPDLKQRKLTLTRTRYTLITLVPKLLRECRIHNMSFIHFGRKWIICMLCVYRKDISVLVISMRRGKEVCVEHLSRGHQANEIHLRSVVTIEPWSLRILGLSQSLMNQRMIL